MLTHFVRGLLLFLLLAAVSGCDNRQPVAAAFDGEVAVGVLHSRTGPLAISEHTVAEAELLAVAEINASGGLLVDGQRLRVVPVEEDGESDEAVFARKAAKLIDISDVDVIFGGWTSSSRKAMLPVIASRRHLLFYPLQYEGEECSEFIFYAGATPNQQAGPAISWLLENKGDRFFLVGSDYVYPRTVNKIIRSQIEDAQASVVAEHYLALGDQALAGTIEKIKSAMPSGGIIINTINGDSNVAFFREAYSQGLTAANGYTIMSFSVAEEEVNAIGPQFLEGSYAAWNFFQALDSLPSRQFTASFKARYGARRVTTDPAEAGYTAVHLWALAATKAGSTDPERVRSALIGTAFSAPQGEVIVTGNHHLRKHVHIGEVAADGQFRIVADGGTVMPQAWSQWLPENLGYRCDWTRSGPDAERFLADSEGDRS